ncbi:MAG: aldo/keto reductase [Longicatena sp.]
MEYRKMNDTYNTSLLGFGCMRFPVLENGDIDEVEAEKMLDLAITHGVNYIDTAFTYHDGESEIFVGKVLKKYPRKDFYVTTKMPLWDIETREAALAMFENQLHKLDVDYVDFYLLHALDKEKWDKVKRLDILNLCFDLQRQGKIRNLGFSFHDDYEVFEEIINDHHWDFCQIQYNYIDTNIQAGEKGYELAQRLNIPLVIMEPIKGGSLAQLPEDIASIFKAYHPNDSISSWALRYVGSKQNVKVILSGMSTLEQVQDNLETFNDFKPLEVEEAEIVNKVAQIIQSRTKNGCTGCGYCMPCPFGIDIPNNFRIWNDVSKYGNIEKAKNKYFNLMDVKQRASACQKCGKCETLCPQQLQIRQDLDKASHDLEKL